MKPSVVWGPELSPFLLKLESMLAFAGLPFRRLPRDGSRAGNLRIAMLVDRAKRRGIALRPPANDPLDEFPLVPYLVTPDREVLYDSSALAPWIDERSQAAPLVPQDPAVRFLGDFLDEAFDEIGLYLVHHNRWKLAAGDNDHPGRRLAREYAKLLPPGAGSLFGSWFERRQVRRLPYLFSVAPPGYAVPGLARGLTPPSREGFPPTHELLEEIWERALAALDDLLATQPFLLGERFTLADASAYGQLSMNLTDTAACRRLGELAPRTLAWLESIRDGRHVRTTGSLALSPRLSPLVALFAETYVPLMRANRAAWERCRADGVDAFNEAAFGRGYALFDGRMLGRPYRTVVKTFQVRSWRDLGRSWAALDATARAGVEAVLPEAASWFEDAAGPSMKDAGRAG